MMDHRPSVVVLLLLTVLVPVLPSVHGTVAAQDADAMTERLRSGQYTEAYEALVRAGTQNDPAALAQIGHALLVTSIGSNDSFVRWSGLRAAQLLNDPTLSHAARKHIGEGGRYEEALALEILARVDLEGSRETFVTALDSPYRTVRMRALRALARLKATSLVDRVADVLTGDPDPDLRALAARTLGLWGAASAVKALRRGVDEEDSVVQQESVKALVALGDREVAGIVRRRLADEPPETHAATARLAALIPDPALLANLGPLLADPDPEIRAFAAAAILSILERVPGERQ